MANWGISENASEKEKLKAEVNDYFHGLNAVGKIDWLCYCELYDVCMPILDKCYDRMKKENAQENGISYYAIENTINEYQSRITGRYATIDEARNDMKNKSDWYVGKPSGNIYQIKEWFDGFNHKVEKRFIERHLGNEIRYSEY